jgi:hypothetical protein
MGRKIMDAFTSGDDPFKILIISNNLIRLADEI